MKEHLLAYMRNQEIGDEYLWKQSAIDQEIFMRDTICSNMLHVPCFVISSHTSKSIHLPVYGFTMRNGVKVIARYNFYDWKLSIELPTVLPQNCYIPNEIFQGDQKKKINSCYLEGFKESWSYGPFKRTAKKFTVEIGHKYNVYMLLYILNKTFSPIEFNIDDDKRNTSEIEKSIIDIYSKNGVYEKRNKPFPGEKEPREIMSAWEVLWMTYSIVSYYKFYKEKGLDYGDIMGIDDDTTKFAEFILKYPELHKEFLLEEYLYNVKY